MASSGISFSQINLQHSKSSSAVLARSMAQLHASICLIQEPWLRGGNIKGLSGIGRLFRDPSQCEPRACILVKACDAILMPIWCNRDLAVIEMDLQGEQGAVRQVVIGSAYFPYDSQEPPPPIGVVELIAHCREKGLPLLLGCDANSHHSVWGSSNVNARGEALLQYLAPMDLRILNRGDDPTFVNAVWREVIDLTLCSGEHS